MARKNILKLTESQLMDVITESVRRVLSESVDEFGFGNRKGGDAFAIYDKKGKKIERGMKVQFIDRFNGTNGYGYVERVDFSTKGQPYVNVRTKTDIIGVDPNDCVVIL